MKLLNEQLSVSVAVAGVFLVGVFLIATFAIKRGYHGELTVRLKDIVTVAVELNPAPRKNGQQLEEDMIGTERGQKSFYKKVTGFISWLNER